MRKCLRCGSDMTEGFVLTHEFSVLEIQLTDDEDVLNKFGNLRAAVCSHCGEISLYTENEDLLEEADEEKFIACPKCGYPVYDDEKCCGHCGWKNSFLQKIFK